jgi:hypothetical protein
MQVPILSGVFTDSSPELRTYYPVNLVPVSMDNAMSSGYLRPSDGILAHGTGPGIVRGGINWNDKCYRVMGDQLVLVEKNGTIVSLGSVGGSTANVTMDYSFDRLAIASNGNLFYWDDTTLTQVTDPDLGIVIDVRWIDGYFLTSDGTSLVVTELNDPTSVNPLKYGSSEIDPDPVKALLKLRNEIWAMNRYTGEIFNNIGGDFFPFQRKEGAQIQKGCVGTHACAVFVEAIAFVGGGRNEQPSVYLGANGSSIKIGTKEVDTILKEYTETELSLIKVEVRNEKTNQMLYIHLPDRTIVYDHLTSQNLGAPAWHVLSSGIGELSKYRANHFVYCYDEWLVGDVTGPNVGIFTSLVGEHWGNVVTWEFGTQIAYNEAKGAIFQQLELVALTGRVAQGTDPRISTSYSRDGATWSLDRHINVGSIGDRTKRLVWFMNGFMRLMRMQRFRGDSSAHLTFARLDVTFEPLMS